MIKVAVVLLGLAVTCGTMLFAGGGPAPKSTTLHVLFIVSSIAFVVAMVIELVRRASRDTQHSMGITPDDPAAPRDDGS